ncbi:hypothetical protein AnigIFM56816_007349 [Aspergillus niger]|nr:hypothetical protein AnigIFM56816_007349 [Aspergillus niger]
MEQQTQNDLPFFNWDDFSPLPGSVTSDITSLLSTRSYPLLKSPNSQNAQSNTSSSSPGDLTPEFASYFNQTSSKQAPLSEPTTTRPQKRQRNGYKTIAQANDRGARRELGDSKINSEERRRLQLRVAQRAYRSRQQATLDGLKNHISTLETSIERMSSAMLSFSEKLVQSGLLRSNSALTAELRDTMTVFLNVASEANLDDEKSVSVDYNKTIDSPPASHQPTIEHPSPNIPLHLPLDVTGLYTPTSANLPYTVNDSSGTSIIGISEFMERLLLAASHQGYLALSNPSIGLNQLQRPFGFIFSMMNRERLTSFFEAELHAQLSQKPLEGWEGIPFFRLGGAGTHYPDQRSSGSFVPRHHRWDTVEDPLSLVTANLRTQLEGDWFDLQDLEGYIREKNVLLLTSAGKPTKCSNVQTNINVTSFITRLVRRGVCLGRTPGFQRDDVEEALRSSIIV